MEIIIAVLLLISVLINIVLLVGVSKIFKYLNDTLDKLRNLAKLVNDINYKGEMEARCYTKNETDIYKEIKLNINKIVDTLHKDLDDLLGIIVDKK